MRTDDVLVEAVGISGFRSFTEVQYLYPLGKVTLLAGQNNAGKSNALRFIRDYLRDKHFNFNDIDRPRRILPQSWKPHLYLTAPKPTDQEIADKFQNLRYGSLRPQDIQSTFKRFLESAELSGPGNLLWLKLEAQHINRSYQSGKTDEPRYTWGLSSDVPKSIAKKFERMHPHLFIAILNGLTGKNWSSGGVDSAVEMLTKHYCPAVNTVAPVRAIEAFRQIRPSEGPGGTLGEFNGVGLIQRLEQLERPSLDDSSDRARFEQINEFVRYILDDSSATLSIPHDAATILIERSGDLLPLESLGTGVQQVIMLAAAATLLDRHLVCIEEPEVHLHPLLQRRLVRYLSTKTSNQYIIATHSAHLLDYDSNCVLHLTHTADSGTLVQHAVTPHAVARICADLGYRPSDLLQANSVIWVEGPSDRIYIRHWIKLIAGDLIEGIDYSIMFYGGRLLRHLTPEDPSAGGIAAHLHESELDEFISLRRLNRHLVIVIDSDVTGPRKKVDATKQRIADAFDSSAGPGFAWITKCYTIENYIQPETLRQAIAKVHPRLKSESCMGQWEQPLKMSNGSSPDKVAIAHEVCRQTDISSLNRYDLRKRIERLVSVIDVANGRVARFR